MFVHVLLRCFSNLSQQYPHKLTFFVVETSMTISSMNIKSGTNGILPCRTKHSITLDLQKQMI